MGYECGIWAGNPGPVITLEEASAGSADDFQIGDLVQIDTSGEIILGSDGHVHAIARSNATGTASTEHQVELINPSAVYSMQCGDTTTEATIGDLEELNTVTSGAQELTAASGTDIALVVGLHPDDGASSTDGSRRILVRFLDSILKGVAA